MKNKLSITLFAVLILCTLLVGIFPTHSATFSKRLIGSQDVYWATGGTDAAETYSAVTADGYTITLNKIDATYLKYRASSLACSVEDFAVGLVNGAYSYTLKLKEAILKGPEVDARAYGSASQATIAAALADIGSKQKTLVLYPNLTDTTTTWTLTDNQTIPSNVKLRVSKGAFISIPTAKTLTPNGGFEAGDYQCIQLAGTAAIDFSNSPTRIVRAIWLGISASVDSSTAINAALASKADAVWAGGGTIVIDSTITWDPTIIALQGCGVKFDATGNSGTAISIVVASAVESFPYPMNKYKNFGWELVGDKATNPSCIGISVDTSNKFGGFDLGNVAIHNFNKGLNLNNLLCYNATFSGVNIYDCTYNLYNNSVGELTHFENCAFFNGGYGIYNNGGFLSFHNCHVNYNTTRQIYQAGGGIIDFSGWIESDTDGPWIENVSGTITIDARFTIQESMTSELILDSGTGAGGIFLKRFDWGIAALKTYSPDQWVNASSNDRVRWDWSRFSGTDVLISKAISLNLDPGFESTTLYEFIMYGSEAATFDNVAKYAGTYSLKFAPTVGNSCKAVFAVTCTPGDTPRMLYYLKYDLSGSTDTFVVTATFYDNEGNSIATGAATTTYAAGTTLDWTKKTASPSIPAPKGAAYCLFAFATPTTSDGNQISRVDEVYINGHGRLTKDVWRSKGSLTLTANQATTTVTNNKATPWSNIAFSATSAGAAADVGSATGVYVSTKGAGSFIVTHPNNATAGKTMDYRIDP